MGRRGSRKRKRNEPLAAGRAEPTVNVEWWKGPSTDPSLDVSESSCNIPTGDRNHNEKEELVGAINENVPDESELNPVLVSLWNSLKRRNPSWSAPSLIQLYLWRFLFEEVQSATTPEMPVIALAPTSSGKTLAYGLPLLAQAFSEKRNSLVIVPTRELAIQVAKELKRVVLAVGSSSTPSSAILNIVPCFGGVKKQEQLDCLVNDSKQVDATIAIGTPGRLLDLFKEVSMSPLVSSIRTVVLDEADRIAMQTDLCQQVEPILTMLTGRRAVCLTSATLAVKAQAAWFEWVRQRPCRMVRVDGVALSQRQPILTESIAKAHDEDVRPEEKSQKEAEPVSHELPGDWLSQIPENLAQVLHVCSEHKKPRKLLTTLRKAQKPDDASNSRVRRLGIVFFNTIKSLKFAEALLQKEGVTCRQLHSHMKQSVREMALNDFRCGKVPLMLATDIAARGIHVDNVSFDINYDFPGNIASYVHRCGRAARGSSKATHPQAATVYSFFTRNLHALASDMIKVLRLKGQWVDPNLEELETNSQGAKQRKLKKEITDELENDDGYGPKLEPLFEEDYDYSPQRIALQRAGHVSDASVSDEE